MSVGLYRYRFRLKLTCVAAVVVFGGSACERSAELSVPAGDPSARSGPCALVSAEELELALSASVAALQEKGRPILVGMKMCAGGSGESAGFWGVLDRSVSTQLAEYERVHEEHLEKVKVGNKSGIWDERLGTLLVQTGDRIVGVRLSVENPPLKKGQTKAEYLSETAGRLAANALERLSDDSS